MNFKLSHDDFELLARYLSLKAKGMDLILKLDMAGQLEVRLTNNNEEQVTVTLFEQKSDSGSSFPKIAVTRRLGDEIK